MYVTGETVHDKRGGNQAGPFTASRCSGGLPMARFTVNVIKEVCILKLCLWTAADIERARKAGQARRGETMRDQKGYIYRR
jgi:hypothetical protein